LIKPKVNLPHVQVTLDDLYLSWLGPFFLSKTFISVGFHYFGFECAWWRLFQTRGTTFDMYVFIWTYSLHCPR